MTTLFPHTKLDWSISRLEDQIQAAPDDPALRIELARSLLSRGLYHGGGEQDCNRALALARKALSDDPANAEALVVAGLSLIGIERQKAATRYFDQAVRIDGERADLRLAMGMADVQRGEPGAGVRNLESACRLAPDSWETHLELGRALLALSKQKGAPKRLVERAQYHFVQALRRSPAAEQLPTVLRDIGVTALALGRHQEAEKFFLRLREHEKFAPVARYHLGLAAYELGKYNNAIQHFRQFLRDRPDDAKVLARIAMAWFQLGEYPRAREACHQALLANPDDVMARHALGCTLLEEGDANEAVKVFRETLKDHPGHLPSYIELVRTRRLGGDVRWMSQALESEVAGYDRLPPGGAEDAKGRTRDRVRVILDELRTIGPSTVPIMLGAVERTQDEGLRFQIWEAACALATSQIADAASARLREPGKHYGASLGGLALSAASSLPEPVLISGLQLEEADLKRAAVDRHPPAHDVAAHRRNLDTERNTARAYQALVLMAIGLRKSAAGKDLLKRWADVADPELAVAAWAGLSFYGEPDASRKLHERGVKRSATAVVDHLLALSTPPALAAQPRRVSDGEATRCTTCGRQPREVTHMMAGGDVVICDLCVVKISQNRASLASPDDATCKLCGRSPFEAAGLYRHNHVDVCSGCLQFSLGMLEREEVDKFFAAW